MLKKRICSMILSFLLVVTLLPASSLTAYAQDGTDPAVVTAEAAAAGAENIGQEEADPAGEEDADAEDAAEDINADASADDDPAGDPAADDDPAETQSTAEDGSEDEDQPAAYTKDPAAEENTQADAGTETSGTDGEEASAPGTETSGTDGEEASVPGTETSGTGSEETSAPGQETETLAQEEAPAADPSDDSDTPADTDKAPAPEKTDETDRTEAVKTDADKADTDKAEELTVQEETKTLEAANDGENIEEFDQETDCHVRVGWDGRVNRWYNAYIEGPEIPDGYQYFESEVVSVEILEERPWQAGKAVLTLEKEYRNNDATSEDYWWHWRAKNFGDAVLKVTCLDYFHQEKSYTFTVFVAHEVYNAGIDTADGSMKTFPGTDVELTGSVWIDSDYPNPSTDNVIYEWILENGNDIAAIEQVFDEPNRAIVHCESQPDDFEGEWLTICLRICDGVDENNEPIERTRAYFNLLVANTYPEVHPFRFPQDLNPGQSKTIIMEVARRNAASQGEDELYEDVHFRWYYDSSKVLVYDEDGIPVGNENQQGHYNDSLASYGTTPEFTFLRLSPEDIEITLWYDVSDGEERFSKTWTYVLENRGFHADLSFENDRLFNDENKVVGLDLQSLKDAQLVEGEDYHIDLELGVWYNDPETGRRFVSFDDGLSADGTDTGYDLILDGNRIFYHADDYDTNEVWLNVRVMTIPASPDEEPLLLCSAEQRFESVESEEYYDTESNRRVLPGWDGSVSGSRNVHIENAAYPYGQDFPYWVTKAEVILDRPDPGETGHVISEFRREENSDTDYWWYYRTECRGRAVISITYRDLNNRERRYEMVVNVGNDVYEVYLDSMGRVRNAFPGDEIDLYADAVHKYLDENNEYHEEADSLGYRWEIVQGADFAELGFRDEDDHSNAVLYFKDMPDGWDSIGEEVRIGVRVLDAGGNSTEAYSEASFWVSDDYTEVWPLELNEELHIFQSIEDQEFEVRRYRLGSEDYEVLDYGLDIEYTWYYDENALSITEEIGGEAVMIPNEGTAEGNTFTITRTGDWGTNARVRASWVNDRGGTDEVWGFYNFRSKDYNIQFEEHDVDWFSDEDKLPEGCLDVSSLGEDWEDRLDLFFIVGIWADDDWSSILEEDEAYTVLTEDGKVYVTLTEEYIETLEDDADIRVLASLYPKEKNEPLLHDTDMWFHVRLAKEEYDFEKDRDLLPGWDGTVDGRRSVRIRNSEYPDGHDEEYEVLDVSVVYDRPAEGESGRVVSMLRKEYENNDGNSDNYWWKYRVDAHGEAELLVTYRDLAGETQGYSIRLSVGKEVYGVSIRPENDMDLTLPGTITRLYADVSHESEEGSTHSLDYEWELLDDGGRYALLYYESDADMSTVMLQIRRQDEEGVWPDPENIWQDVRVRLNVYVREEEETLVATDEFRMTVAGTFYQILPLSISNGLCKGDTESVDAQVLLYTIDSGMDNPDYVQDVHFHWSYDENKIVIRDQGNTIVGNDHPDTQECTGWKLEFRIERKESWGTDIFLQIDWEDEAGEHHEGRQYRLGEQNYDVWFEWTDDSDRLYSDGVKHVFLNTKNLENVNGAECEFEPYYLEAGGNSHTLREDQYEIRAVEGGFDIALDGRVLCPLLAAAETDELILRAAAFGRFGDELDEEYVSVFAEETRIEYDRENNRSMLPGWDGTVNGRNRVRIWNTEHPEGLEEEYSVTNVRVVRDVPWEGEPGAVVTDIHEDQDDEGNTWWYYRVGNHGEADLEVTYLDIDGEEQTYTFTLYVGTDVYEVDLVTGNGSLQALPGTTVTLLAKPGHFSEIDDTLEGLGYEWELLDDGETYATLTQSQDKPNYAELSLREKEVGEGWLDREVRVHVRLFTPEDEEGHRWECASAEIRIRLCEEYDEIWPVFLEPGLDIGTDLGVTAEVRHYKYKEDQEKGYELNNDVHFRWYYDPEDGDLVVTDCNGDPVGGMAGLYTDTAYTTGDEVDFTVKRLSTNPTKVDLNAYWYDQDGHPRDMTSEFRFDEKVYSIWFEEDEPGILSYGRKELTVKVEDVVQQLDYTLMYIVGIRENGVWEEVLPQDCYEVDGNKITLIGKYIKNSGWESVDVVAQLFCCGWMLNEAACMVSVEYADCPHAHLNKVAAKAPTLTKEGNIEYYICEDCDAMFADAGKQTPLTWEEIVIPRLISISTAEVTGVSGKTYNGKAQTQKPVVKINGVTLKLNTDYQLSYKNNTNAGQATMTITGKGLYAGSKAVTFRISPANISGRTATLQYTSTAYTGKQLKPTVTITGLKKDTDFTVSYGTNTKPGKGTVTASGKGNYTGRLTATFMICFTDVPMTHNFQKSVYWAVENKVASGYDDGSFGINDNVTRGQFVMLLWKMAGKPEPHGKTQIFNDVPTSSNFFKPVQWAYERKITTGYTDGSNNFGVKDPCTRAQLVMFLWRYAEKPVPKGTTQTFTDVPVKSAFYKAIQWASEEKITTGYKDGSFGVNTSCTRGHCVTFLCRFMT